jgi:carbon monoxide dehydrogenase subunit G
MILVDEGVSIGRGREAVFDYLVDLDVYPSWQPAVKQVQLIDDAVPRAGSRIRAVIETAGRDTDVEIEITEFDRPRRLSTRTLSGPATMTGNVVLDATNEPGSTRLTLHAEIHLTGLLRFAEGIVRHRITEQLPSLLWDLRDRIEREVDPETHMGPRRKSCATRAGGRGAGQTGPA